MTLDKPGITCLECGARFTRRRGYVGEYCEECRPDPEAADE